MEAPRPRPRLRRDNGERVIEDFERGGEVLRFEKRPRLGGRGGRDRFLTGFPTGTGGGKQESHQRRPGEQADAAATDVRDLRG